MVRASVGAGALLDCKTWPWRRAIYLSAMAGKLIPAYQPGSVVLSTHGAVAVPRLSKFCVYVVEPVSTICECAAGIATNTARSAAALAVRMWREDTAE